MKAVVLAAGRGMRLRPLTDVVPKCMVAVGGKPVLHWNVDWLRRHGITDLAVNLHHLPDVVTRYFGDGSHLGVRISWSYEPRLLGTAGTVRSLAGWLGDERFLVIYGDNIHGCRLDKLLACHVGAQPISTMALFRRDDVSASGVAEVGPDGRIVDFVEKPGGAASGAGWVNAGLLVCEPALLDYVAAGPDMARDVIPALLAAGAPVVAYPMSPDETLAWIDTPADLARLQPAEAVS